MRNPKFARPAETRSFTNVLLLKSTEDPQISSEDYQTRNLNTAYVSSTDEDAVAFRDSFGAAVTMRNDKFWSNVYMSAFSCHPRGKENKNIKTKEKRRGIHLGKYWDESKYRLSLM